MFVWFDEENRGGVGGGPSVLAPRSPFVRDC